MGENVIKITWSHNVTSLCHGSMNCILLIWCINCTLIKYPVWDNTIVCIIQLQFWCSELFLCTCSFMHYCTFCVVSQKLCFNQHSTNSWSRVKRHGSQNFSPSHLYYKDFELVYILYVIHFHVILFYAWTGGLKYHRKFISIYVHIKLLHACKCWYPRSHD